MGKRVVDMTIKPEETQEKNKKKKGGSKPTNRNYYNKHGQLLHCENEHCNNPRMKGAPWCRECRMVELKKHPSNSWTFRPAN